MLVRRQSTLISLSLLLMVGSGGPLPAKTVAESECFDTEITARVVAQVPTVVPEPDDGSIIVRWPWFLDLEVRRAGAGKAKKRRVTVLAMRHTWSSDRTFRRWRLRRNDQGTFNLLGLAAYTRLPRCTPEAPPAAAYIRPAKDQTLDSLRQEGERLYGSGS